MNEPYKFYAAPDPSHSSLIFLRVPNAWKEPESRPITHQLSLSTALGQVARQETAPAKTLGNEVYHCIVCAAVASVAVNAGAGELYCRDHAPEPREAVDCGS